MINLYHEELEYDFDVRGWDLIGGLWRGALTLRKLAVRIRHLPRDSALARALDPAGTRWGETEHLIATLIDTLHAANSSDYRYPRPGTPEEQAAIERVERARDHRARMRDRFDKRERRRLTEGRAG